MSSQYKPRLLEDSITKKSNIKDFCEMKEERRRNKKSFKSQHQELIYWMGETKHHRHTYTEII